MKRVRIHAGQVGLVMRNGDYNRVISQGTHWLWYNESVIRYSLSVAFNAPKALDILIQDQNLADMLHIVEIQDNEIVLVYSNGNFKHVLSAGRHAYWNQLIDYKFVTVNFNDIAIPDSIDKALYNNAALRQYIRAFEVATYEKAVLIVDDKFHSILDHGTYHYWRNNQTIRIAKADLRQLQLEIAGQELLTKDKATVRINFYVQYKVTDIKTALLENKD